MRSFLVPSCATLRHIAPITRKKSCNVVATCYTRLYVQDYPMTPVSFLFLDQTTGSDYNIPEGSSCTTISLKTNVKSEANFFPIISFYKLIHSLIHTTTTTYFFSPSFDSEFLTVYYAAHTAPASLGRPLLSSILTDQNSIYHLKRFCF